jgi:hypothetical protein
MNKCCQIDQSKFITDCQLKKSKPPFTVYHNGHDGASIINLKGEDVTEYFNISIEHGHVEASFKTEPSYEEFMKIAGKL